MVARKSKKRKRKDERKQRKKEKRRENKDISHGIEAKRWIQGNQPSWRCEWFLFRTFKTAAKRDRELKNLLQRKNGGDRGLKRYDFRECSLKKKKDGGAMVSTG